jgi:hypothetical protein
MANPPFNVDLVDAERIKSDPRLPFGLPGVNKDKKVSNGNYLWISYFWSYLNEKGRAGFVMSSQASSAGHSEKEVRKKIVETGDVDVIISIRSNFFYTRTVPCELCFFDRAKPAERKDKVLMLDARQIYRKVTRTIYDFPPEQMQNLSAIVWLYRGQQHRFLALIRDYLGAVCTESIAIPAKLAAFEKTLADLRSRFSGLVKGVDQDGTLDADKKKALVEAATELADAEKPYETDRARLLAELDSFRMQHTAVTALPPGEEPGLWETNLAFIDDDQAAQLSHVTVEPRDILLNITGASVARCCMVPERHLPARVNQHVMIIRVDATLADPSFVLCAINSDQRKRQLLSYAQVGATREALTKETITNFEIVLPDEKLLRQFSEVARAINQQRAVLAHQNADLRAARDLLLPRLMSGEIAV